MASHFRRPSAQPAVNEPEPPPQGEILSKQPSIDELDTQTKGARVVVLEDDELVAMAEQTKRSIEWRSVMLSARFGPERWQEQDVSSQFRVYTRHESHRYDVLAVGVVPGCVAEILNVLQSPTSEQYAQQMEAIFGNQVRAGEILHRAVFDRVDQRADPIDGSELVDLTVNRVAFNKANWLANHEEWCYLDAVYRAHRNGERDSVVEKFMTTMQSRDLLANTGAVSATSTSAFHDVVCGYLLRAGAEDAHDRSATDDGTVASQNCPAPRETRVSFYAEFEIPKQVAFSLAATKGWRRSVAASDKTIKQRMIKLANSTARLTTLVRRQRLGLQVLADDKRFLPPTNVPCKVCTRMLLVAKQCRVCGQGVCGDCSDKHERARVPRGRRTLEVTQIRVCAYCIERIDQADYANLTTSSLLGTHVVPNPANEKSATGRLKQALQDVLVTETSPSRKSSVKSVIQSLIEQDDREYNRSSSNRSSSLVLTASSPDMDFVEALDYLDVDEPSAEEVALRSDDHRCYLLDTSGSAAVPTPVPEDEEARLLSVEGMSGSELATVIELEILCDLAAREMGCATSAISLVDRDEYYGVASNSPALRNARIPRTQTICSHTMMEKELPNLVIHPEADIRFSKFDSVRELGVRFYCAFPLIGEDNQVIGTMCCLHGESLEITESQIAAFKKLAATASKVMRVETRKRRRKESSTSSTTSIQ